MKLSKTQQELFDAMKAGLVVHYMPYAGRFNPNPYYFRTDNMKRCTAAASGLTAKGVATHVGREFAGGIKLVLKETP